MSLNILVVDDSPVMRKIVLRVLRMSSLPVRHIFEASDGHDAWTLLQNHTDINLGVFDLNMPIMNGEELIARIRADATHRGLPIVVVSTEGSAKRVARLKRRGVRFLQKPFEPELLIQTIGEATGAE